MQKIFEKWFVKHFTDLIAPSDFLYDVWMGGVRYGRGLTKFYVSILTATIRRQREEIAELRKELAAARNAAFKEGLRVYELESKLLENRTFTEVDHG